MIFNSVAMQNLREKYAGVPDFRVPKIVFLDRSDDLSGEREYLEQLMQSVEKGKQKEWMGRLLSADDAQHLSAWFEIMLLDWLRKIGPTVAEPEVEGNYPDFSLSIGKQQIMIEARARAIDDAERKESQREAEIVWMLNEIKLPYIVVIEKLELGESPDVGQAAIKVINWLNTSPSVPFRYQDEQGNKLFLTAQSHPTLSKVATVGLTKCTWVTPRPLKAPLREKAGQHSALRRAGHPYVLAILLESHTLSAEEVAEAWFGRPQAVVDLGSGQIVEETIDGSGLHFFGSEVRHRTVSGTLVFRAQWNGEMERHRLRAWYIQNPYATAPVAPRLFPVEDRFIVLNRDASTFSMGWQRDS